MSNWSEGYDCETQPPPNGRWVLAKFRSVSSTFAYYRYGNHSDTEYCKACVCHFIGSSPQWGDEDYFCDTPERWWPLPGEDTKPA